MSKVGISISIDVTKIDKSRLFTGKKGVYMDLTTFIDLDEKDQYDNNGFISQSQTKEERDAGADRTPILGNCKVFFNDGATQPTPPSMIEPAPADDPFGSDPIPF